MILCQTRGVKGLVPLDMNQVIKKNKIRWNFSEKVFQFKIIEFWLYFEIPGLLTYFCVPMLKEHYDIIELSVTKNCNILGEDYMTPAWRDEISTSPDETDFNLRLHVEIKFRPSKAGQFSTWYLIRFAYIFFRFFFVSMSFCKTEDS